MLSSKPVTVFEIFAIKWLFTVRNTDPPPLPLLAPRLETAKDIAINRGEEDLSG